MFVELESFNITLYEEVKKILNYICSVGKKRFLKMGSLLSTQG